MKTSLDTDLLLDTVQPVIDLFFDDHVVDMTRQKDFLMLRSIRVVSTALSGYKCVQFTNHVAVNMRD